MKCFECFFGEVEGMSWFKKNFGSKNNKSNKKNNAYASTNGQNSDANASGSLTDAMLFPAQYYGPTYGFDSFPDELFFIPYREASIPRQNPSNLFTKSQKLNHEFGICALLIHGNPKNNPTHFMILFHGNGVDLGLASIIWRPLIRALPIHLLIVEYPGYGIMDGRCTCKQVIKVAKHAYEFVTRPQNNGGLGIPTSKLMILGRSIGTGAASHIAKFECQTLILVSPFTSIHNLSSDLMGKWTNMLLPKDYEDEDDEDAEMEMMMMPKLQKSVSDPLRSPREESKEMSVKEIKIEKKASKKSTKKNAEFVFNNVAQIDKWKCKNFMIFHGKRDEIIPYAHTNTIVNTVKQRRPKMKMKKFLMDGVGHNDINIQFIGLRIFMQYQEDLQSSMCLTNIDSMTSYVDNPPQFDVVTNKIKNYHLLKSHKKQLQQNKNGLKMMNEWNFSEKGFDKFQRYLPTKVIDLSFKLKMDAQRKKDGQAKKRIDSGWL